jgi:DNA-binding beta-propeller fold protein YncE
MRACSRLCLALAIAVSLFPAPLHAQFAYVANAGSDNVSAYSIGADGALTAVPGSPFAAGFDASSVAVDPTGKFAYVANEGGNVSALSAWIFTTAAAFSESPERIEQSGL